MTFNFSNVYFNKHKFCFFFIKLQNFIFHFEKLLILIIFHTKYHVLKRKYKDKYVTDGKIKHFLLVVPKRKAFSEFPIGLEATAFVHYNPALC